MRGHLTKKKSILVGMNISIMLLPIMSYSWTLYIKNKGIMNFSNNYGLEDLLGHLHTATSSEVFKSYQ